MSVRLVLSDALPVLDARGWMQGDLEAKDGRVCLTGALKYCAWEPGDWLLARAVLRSRGRAEDWNDASGRTEAEVRALLAETTITDADLEAVFGPQWEQVVALVRRVAVLSPEDVRALSVAWHAAQVEGHPAWKAAWNAAWKAAEDAAREVAREAAREAAGDAAWALVVRDLISPDGFTQAHYDTLTGPWRRTIGPIHPDDEELRG